MSEFFGGGAVGSEPSLRDTAKAGLAGAFENDPCSCSSSSEVDQFTKSKLSLFNLLNCMLPSGYISRRKRAKLNLYNFSADVMAKRK